MGVEKYPFLGMKYEKDNPNCWANEVVLVAKIKKRKNPRMMDFRFGWYCFVLHHAEITRADSK